MGMSDEDLMISYRDGSETAFTELYRRHKERVFSFIRKRVQPETKQNEIFQEVFIKLHRSKSLYEKKFKFLPWLFTVTRNVMLDELRKDKTYQKQLEDFESEARTLSPTNETGMSAGFDLDAAKLTPDQKSALTLRYFEDKEFNEIADILKTSESNVRKIISRALASLRKSMSGDKP